VLVDEMQFAYSPGMNTTDAVVMVRQVLEFRARWKKLYFAFLDLEKCVMEYLGKVQIGFG
jgi:hypothetical protein